MENNPAGDLMNELNAANARINALTADLDEAVADRDRVIRSLRNAGVEPGALDDATGLDHVTVRKIIDAAS